MSKRIAIIGAGGFAREVLDICDACNEAKPTYEVMGFIVDRQYGSAGTMINEKPILGDFAWLEEHRGQVLVTCAVGSPHHRYRLIQRAETLGCEFFNLIHPSAILTPWITLGRGIIITAGCILTNRVRIGNHVHVDMGCTVAHDVTLEDFVRLSPGVHVSGNVSVRTGCFVGTGASVIEKLELGEWSVVGAGSTIIRDVPTNSIVVGVPGKVITTRNPGWHLELHEA